MKLIFVSHNLNKAEEIRASIAPTITFKTLSEIGYTDEIPENGTTFHENAQQKAVTVYETLLIPSPVFAEDSGLEIEALDGQPGVHSARYAGMERNNEANIQKVLAEMEGHTNRNAQFQTVICIIEMGKKVFFEGIIRGTIAQKPRGTNGFGYDSIFIPQHSTRTFAEMSTEEKNAISHRRQAIEKMERYLSGLDREGENIG